MTAYSNHDAEESRARQGSLQQGQALAQGQTEAGSLTDAQANTAQTLFSPSIAGRGNSSVRANAALSMQQTYSNSATRRFVQRQSVSSSGSPGVQVSRQQASGEGAKPASTPGPPGPGWEPIPGTKNLWGTTSPTTQVKPGPAHNLPPFENGPTDEDGNPMPSLPSKEASPYGEGISKAGEYVSNKLTSLLEWF